MTRSKDNRRLSSCFCSADNNNLKNFESQKFNIFDIQHSQLILCRNWKLRAHHWWWRGRWPEQWGASIRKPDETFPESPLRCCREMLLHHMRANAPTLINLFNAHDIVVKNISSHCKVVVKIFAACTYSGNEAYFVTLVICPKLCRCLTEHL